MFTRRRSLSQRAVEHFRATDNGRRERAWFYKDHWQGKGDGRSGVAQHHQVQLPAGRSYPYQDSECHCRGSRLLCTVVACRLPTLRSHKLMRGRQSTVQTEKRCVHRQQMRWHRVISAICEPASWKSSRSCRLKFAAACQDPILDNAWASAAAALPSFESCRLQCLSGPKDKFVACRCRNPQLSGHVGNWMPFSTRPGSHSAFEDSEKRLKSFQVAKVENDSITT
ncbi:hypothetical protein N658DRAFT_198795 [Parathielavia hyrcaniae]|uniref:Uncharacterized protein n=1 Tax=Parathielavia hyrcaniae TaxID=113614 RepID=A0AAN6Q7H5_9PEZI|nr:hypothetical protein N658DRAFT_198795 [Parathielavia hyrcaniae]